MQIGIESFAFSTSSYVLDLALLAQARQKDVNAYAAGFKQMSVAPPDEDIVTLAASAAQEALKDTDASSIDYLLLATETGVDQSKAAGLYVQKLLDLPRTCRIVELKQACYSGTAALQLAVPYLSLYPDKKVLLIATDIARYTLNTPGEASQGCAAIAMVLSAQPRILSFEAHQGFVSEDLQDFWRPNYTEAAIVDGKYSSRLYLTLLLECWNQFQEKSQLKFNQIASICYHTPVPKLVEKAQQKLMQIAGSDSLMQQNANALLQHSLSYARRLGNSYTATLMIALASLLDHLETNLEGERIGFYSYGSGSVAEFFSGILLPGYEKNLHTTFHQQQIQKRQSIDVKDYEDFYHALRYSKSGNLSVGTFQTTPFRFAGLKNHQRQYEKVQ